MYQLDKSSMSSKQAERARTYKAVILACTRIDWVTTYQVYCFNLRSWCWLVEIGGTRNRCKCFLSGDLLDITTCLFGILVTVLNLLLSDNFLLRHSLIGCSLTYRYVVVRGRELVWFLLHLLRFGEHYSTTTVFHNILRCNVFWSGRLCWLPIWKLFYLGTHLVLLAEYDLALEYLLALSTRL